MPCISVKMLAATPTSRVRHHFSFHLRQYFFCRTSGIQPNRW